MRLVGWLGAMATLLLALSGCTTSAVSSLTGGSVPIGDVDGYVYSPLRAASTDPIAGTDVVLMDAGGAVLQSTRTDSAGHFSFAGAPVGQMLVQAGDPQTLSALAQVERGVDEHLAVVLTLAPPRVDGITSITLAPSSASVHEGEEVAFAVYDQTGTQPISGMAVSWMVRGRRGGDGMITPDGRFTGSRAGTYTVVAQYWTRGTCLSAESDVVVSRR